MNAITKRCVYMGGFGGIRVRYRKYFNIKIPLLFEPQIHWLRVKLSTTNKNVTSGWKAECSKNYFFPLENQLKFRDFMLLLLKNIEVCCIKKAHILSFRVCCHTCEIQSKSVHWFTDYLFIKTVRVAQDSQGSNTKFKYLKLIIYFFLQYLAYIF